MLNHLATASTSVYNLITSWAFFSFILDALVIFIEQYLFRLDAKHLYYLKWFLILTFAILPFIFIGLLYLSVILYQIHKKDHDIIENIADDLQNHNWKVACRRMTAACWKWTAILWNGYSLIIHEESKKLMSLSNKDTPVMLIYYHGALPLDLYYTVMISALNKDMKVISPCVDRFLFKIPFFAAALRFWQCICGPREKIVETLLKGDIVALSPGGTREAIFSKNYNLLWKDRVGFAECLISCKLNKLNNQSRNQDQTRKVAVLPMFTKNLRSMLDYPSFIKNRYVKYFYETFKWPLYPLFGGFPVRLTTYIGEPIYVEDFEKDAKKIS